jgi:hypothetical protein
MNFWKEHFDHLLLAGMAILSAGTGVFCDTHGHTDASKWLYGQAGGFAGALMLRMNGIRPNAPGPDGPKA